MHTRKWDRSAMGIFFQSFIVANLSFFAYREQFEKSCFNFFYQLFWFLALNFLLYISGHYIPFIKNKLKQVRKEQINLWRAQDFNKNLFPYLPILKLRVWVRKTLLSYIWFCTFLCDCHLHVFKVNIHLLSSLG